MQNLHYLYFDFGLKSTIALASCIKNFHFNHLVYQFWTKRIKIIDDCSEKFKID